MILITITGKTFPIRKLFKDNKFQFFKNPNRYERIVGEGSLNTIIESIRPEHQTVHIKLESVEYNGRLIEGRKSWGGELRPEDAKYPVDYLEIMQRD